MKKNGRWISRELKHLDENMKMLQTDIKFGNKASALTNWGLAMGIIKGMIEKDKKSIRGIEKAGQIIGAARKTLRPLFIEAGAIAIDAYEKKLKKGR